jgi:hypothetical protein
LLSWQDDTDPFGAKLYEAATRKRKNNKPEHQKDYDDGKRSFLAKTAAGSWRFAAKSPMGWVVGKVASSGAGGA